MLSLPTENATARMRAWRALKASGAAALRDGVYLMPATDGHAQSLLTVVDDVRANGGEAQVFEAEPHDGADYGALFDRGPEFGTLLAEIATCRAGLSEDAAQQVMKQARKVRKAFDQLVAIDFFPGEAQAQTAAALRSLEADAAQATALDEPHAAPRAVQRLDLAQYQSRVWATRRRLWVDRAASAWLIRRFIDRDARFQWLAKPSDCPRKALGFDFDGATFTHVGERVTFEVLMASFGLEEDPALVRLGTMVHSLDVGGAIPPRRPVSSACSPACADAITDDDQLVLTAAGVFEGLLVAFEKRSPHDHNSRVARRQGDASTCKYTHIQGAGKAGVWTKADSVTLFDAFAYGIAGP